MDIFEEILTALQTEPRVMLATIISTTGSTPASALSKMLVKQGGLVSVGTVGGGCMEGNVLLHANRLRESGKAEIRTFHLNEDDVEHGLICGGTLDVLIEPVTRTQLPLLEKLKTLREEGTDCVLAAHLNSGGQISRFLAHPLESPLPISHIAHHIANFDDLPTRSLRRQETIRLPIEEGELILEPVAGCPSLIIFGGGHVSKFVSRAASMAGFRTTIVDDREKYANSARFPEAVRTVAVDFPDAFRHLTVTPSTYLLIVTRGHGYDETVLAEALKTPAKYIGMIGSRRKVMTAFKHLSEAGVLPDRLRRIHAPVGIEIGAITAEEIAVSIVAQLINVRRGGKNLVHDKSEEMHAQLPLLDEKHFIA
jgi:xanthine dehydrogenase accessory factor